MTQILSAFLGVFRVIRVLSFRNLFRDHEFDARPQASPSHPRHMMPIGNVSESSAQADW